MDQNMNAHGNDRRILRSYSQVVHDHGPVKAQEAENYYREDIVIMIIVKDT